ncbi:acid protease [Amylocystis lapponica]|nr:acid protease [Amylocystis lapponica]
MLSTTKASILALCLSHVVCAAYVNLHKRATAPPATINIPLLFGSSGRYIIPVGMSTGNVQNFNFTLSTSTGLTSVAGTGCTSCSQTGLYNQSASSSASSLGTSDNVSLANAAYRGSLIKEDCTMRTMNGSAWNYPNQTSKSLLVANNQNGPAFDDDVSGLLGLGTNRNVASSSTSGYSPAFDDTIYGQWLNRNPSQSQFSYGMEISAPIITPKNTSNPGPTVVPNPNAGQLHWLNPSQSSYDNNQVATTSVQSVSNATYASSSSQPDWTVSNAQDMVTTVDPYYTDIYFPLAQAQLLNQAIPGSTFEPTVSSQSFTLDQSVLVIDIGNGVCVSGIEGWQDQSVSQYILGALFLSQVYVIFNIAPNHTGAIVGGTVGGVAGLLLIAFAVLFFFRRRNHHVRELRTDMLAEEEHKFANTVEPYTVGGGGAVEGHRPTFISPPMSPTASSPLLEVEPRHEEVMPPAYEATEGSSTGGSRGEPPLMRTAKGEYIRPLSMQSSADGSTNVGSPSRPTFTSIPEA